MYNEGDPGVKNNVYYRILTLVASVCVCVQLLSSVCHFATPGTVALKFFKQEYWSGCHFLFQRDLPNPGIESGSSALAGRFFTIVPPTNSLNNYNCHQHAPRL